MQTAKMFDFPSKSFSILCHGSVSPSSKYLLTRDGQNDEHQKHASVIQYNFFFSSANSRPDLSDIGLNTVLISHGIHFEQFFCQTVSHWFFVEYYFQNYRKCELSFCLISNSADVFKL